MMNEVNEARGGWRFQANRIEVEVLRRGARLASTARLLVLSLLAVVLLTPAVSAQLIFANFTITASNGTSCDCPPICVLASYNLRSGRIDLTTGLPSLVAGGPSSYSQVDLQSGVSLQSIPQVLPALSQGIGHTGAQLLSPDQVSQAFANTLAYLNLLQPNANPPHGVRSGVQVVSWDFTMPGNPECTCHYSLTLRVHHLPTGAARGITQ
ncbi:MAG TPA: hypothetical protein PKA37_05695 [Planctomycetota bacterium]|jgi:hypothetical protein|nr:hypothetical protein [Planctomycetota bacterium]